MLPSPCVCTGHHTTLIKYVTPSGGKYVAEYQQRLTMAIWQLQQLEPAKTNWKE